MSHSTVKALLLGLLLSLPRAGSGEALEIRFYPDRVIRAYELEARRGLRGVLLQNAAIVNRSAKPILLERVEVTVRAGGETVAARHLQASDLERAAKRADGLSKAGLIEAYAFQFRSDRLLKDARLSAERQLAPGAALLLGHVYLAFGGAPDRLGLRAFGRTEDGAAVESEGTLPLDPKLSANEYDFPLAGTWFVGAGATLHDHHRWVVPEEFALDIARLGEGMKSHRGTGATRTDYYAYGEPVLAAADGVVRAAEDGVTETDEPLRKPGESAEAYEQRLGALQAQLLTQGTKGIAGNHVVVEHAGAESSLYAHLRTGSVKVKPGEAVKRGQAIGKVGLSGNVTEPHLHFHVTDGPDPLLSAGVPVGFRNVELPWAVSPRAPQSGDIVIAR
jgi:murein DD-endopeptidase MepM/ murein hydrolase activator NlpD